MQNIYQNKSSRAKLGLRLLRLKIKAGSKEMPRLHCGEHSSLAIMVYSDEAQSILILRQK